MRSEGRPRLQQSFQSRENSRPPICVLSIRRVVLRQSSFVTQPSPPPSPESAPPSLSTSPPHRPCRTCTQTASAAPPAAPHPSHTASASHPCPAPTRSLPRQASGLTQYPR